MQYTAYAEDWVHLQHTVIDFAGGARKAESSLNLRWANMEQGMIAMSIPSNARGYLCKVGDRFIPVDAVMQFTDTLERDRFNASSRHRFVTRVVRAYGLNAANKEIEVTAQWAPKNQRWTLTPPAGEALPERVVIVYDACPVYYMYLDSGEFRHPMSQDHHRLVLMIRDEVVK